MSAEGVPRKVWAALVDAHDHAGTWSAGTSVKYRQTLDGLTRPMV